MAMFVDIALDDTLTVGDIVIKLQFKTGRKCRLKIDAPRSLSVSIKKEETQLT